MATNAAAWLTAAKARPLEVRPALLVSPGENEVLVKNHALAINPIDGDIQETAWMPLDYPAIIGGDIAGEVVEVGPNVTRFKKGDRVISHAVGYLTKQQKHYAFQEYTVVPTNMTSEIPDSIPYENAVVIPLTFSTAAAGLFREAYLNLQPPKEPAQAPTGQALLIWGGASSVGSNGIQLAVAAGYEVITTASPRNFEYVKKLGASQVFDYNSSTVVSDIVTALRGKKLAGTLDCIGLSATPVVVEVVQQSEGNKFISTTKRGFAEVEGITIKHVFATTITTDHVGKMVFEDYLPKALKAGSFVPSPRPVIAGKGLESIQAGIDLQRTVATPAKAVVLL